MLKDSIQQKPRVRADYDHHNGILKCLSLFPQQAEPEARNHMKYAIALGPPLGIGVKGRTMRQERRGINILLLCYNLS